MSMSDSDEVQMFRNWMKEYGYYILFSILAFLIVNFGWRYWKQYKEYKLGQATVMYDQVLQSFDKEKNEELKLFGEKLIKNHPKTIYASLASLTLAKHYVDSGDLKSAQENFEFVIKEAPSKEVKELARVRVARILIALKDPQKALDTLANSQDDGFYASTVNEVRGDALLKLGKNEEAEKAYSLAKSLNTDVSSQPPLLKMKMQQF